MGSAVVITAGTDLKTDYTQGSISPASFFVNPSELGIFVGEDVPQHTAHSLITRCKEKLRERGWPTPGAGVVAAAFQKPATGKKSGVTFATGTVASAALDESTVYVGYGEDFQPNANQSAWTAIERAQEVMVEDIFKMGAGEDVGGFVLGVASDPGGGGGLRIGYSDHAQSGYATAPFGSFAPAQIDVNGTPATVTYFATLTDALPATNIAAIGLDVMLAQDPGAGTLELDIAGVHYSLVWAVPGRFYYYYNGSDDVRDQAFINAMVGAVGGTLPLSLAWEP